MKKELVIVGTVVLLIIVGLSGCINEEEEQTSNLSDMEYWQYGFGINPPGEIRFAYVSQLGLSEYWYVNESHQGYEVLFELMDSSMNKKNVSLGVTRLHFTKNNELVSRHVYDNRSLEEYASENMKYWYDMLTNVTYISNATTTINDMDAYVSVFRGLWNETLMYKQKHIYIEKNSATFHLIYSSLENLYDTYIEAVNESITSFTIQ